MTSLEKSNNNIVPSPVLLGIKEITLIDEGKVTAAFYIAAEIGEVIYRREVTQILSGSFHKRAHRNSFDF